MNKIRSMGMMVVAAITLSVQAYAADKSWLTDLEKAQEQAKAENKQILIDFTGSDWCGWCVKLNREVFSQQQFKSYAKKNLVLLEVDFPKKKQLPADQLAANRKLAHQYGVQGYPTIIVLNPDGSKAGKLGYVEGGAPAFIAKLKKAAPKS